MGSVEQIQRNRFLFLHALYEGCEGDTLRALDPFRIGEDLGYSLQETGDIVLYLHDEQLVSSFEFAGTRMALCITFKGAAEVVQAMAAPERPTEHFPPLNVLSP